MSKPKLEIEFDRETLDPMFESRVQKFRRHPIIVAYLESLEGVDSVDDLSNRQKARLCMSFEMLRDLVKFESGAAAEAARLAKADEIIGKFKLEVGDE